MKLETATVASPIGDIRLAMVPGGAVCALVFADHWPAMRAQLERRFGADVATEETDGGAPATSVRAYVAGDLHALDAIPVDVAGTPFQRAVWLALRTIPAGDTRSYAAHAREVGAPRAVRAVGAANGQNPVSLILPCHRVIGKDGTLTGYGGGLHRKRWLLEHERARGASLWLGATPNSH